MTRFAEAIAMIDRANAADPTSIETEQGRRPAELVYGERMMETLKRLSPGASELLQLAARAQHIKRWTVPRGSYPEGRAGYHRWRGDLKSKHAEWAGEILLGAGYSTEEAARVGQMIRKERLKSDPETQLLEDTAALVFLEHYAADFVARHDDAKVVDILVKTLAKMSLEGHLAATHARLPPRVKALLDRAILEAGNRGQRAQSAEDA